MNWETNSTYRSKSCADVKFSIRRMTFGRRIELMRQVRDLGLRLEFFEAGRDQKNQMEASLLAAEIDRLYLQWGLAAVSGLKIDGIERDVFSFIEMAPEHLVQEALQLVRSECELSADERKN